MLPPKRLYRGKEVEITAEECAAVINALPEGIPDAPDVLLEQSKNPKHLLHHEIWGDTDSECALRWRRNRCREIISGHKRVEYIGGKTIEFRSVEFVRTPEGGRWCTPEAILNDEVLEQSYIADCNRLMEQAMARLKMFKALRYGKKADERKAEKMKEPA